MTAVLQVPSAARDHRRGERETKLQGEWGQTCFELSAHHLVAVIGASR